MGWDDHMGSRVKKVANKSIVGSSGGIVALI